MMLIVGVVFICVAVVVAVLLPRMRRDEGDRPVGSHGGRSLPTA